MDAKIVKKQSIVQKTHVLFFEGDLIKDEKIIACIENPDRFSQEPYLEKQVNIEEFKSFLHNQNAFDWCIDSFHPSSLNGHRQEEGTITWEQYCAQDASILLKDLTDFLINKNKQ
jgi:hypothetical protein